MFCALYIPDFAAAAVIRAEPGLRRQAVAVLEGTPPLLRVSALNETARLAGVEIGMTKSEVEALPSLALRRRALAQEAAAAAALLDCACGFSPRVEPLAPGSVLFDAAGLERLFGPPQELAEKVAAQMVSLGLDANLALAANREAAIHASRGFSGVTLIAPGEEARRLGELPIDVLFAGPDASGSPNCRTAELPNGCHPGRSVRAADAESREPCSREVSQGYGSTVHAVKNNPASAEGKASRRRSRTPREYREAPSFDDSRTASSFGSSALRQFGSAFVETLDRWGVHNLRGFAALPTVAVAERLGQEGVRLQKLARGEGSHDLHPADPPLRFEEAVELEHPVELLEPLAFILSRLLEQLCTRLSARALATNELRLDLTLDTAIAEDATENPRRHGDTENDNFQTSHPERSGHAQHDRGFEGSLRSHDSSSQFGSSAVRQSGNSSHSLCAGFFSRTLKLPVPMLDARLFLKLLQLDLKQHPPGAPVLKVELAAAPVRPQLAQHGLFQAATPAPEKLQLMLARLAGIVGEGNAGSPELLDTHGRDAFVMRPFAAETSPVVGRPSAKNPPRRHEGAENDNFNRSHPERSEPQPDRAVEASLPATKNFTDSHPQRTGGSAFQSGNSAVRQSGNPAALAARILRPGLPVTVTIRDDTPVRLACAGDGSRPPISGEIAWASGPWRSSGDWWTEAPMDGDGTRYTRDEWDVSVRAAGADVLCRLVHDLEAGKWLLEAIYD